MAINARAVLRVIIDGEWIWVERGTFTVIDFQFEDDDGNMLNRGREPAYFFVSTNGDPYFGPLTSVSLIKLDNQILEEGGGDVADKVRMRALGSGDDEERAADGAEQGAGEDSVPDAGAPDAVDVDPDEGDKPGSVPLFADDADDADDAAGADEDTGRPRPKSGLF